MEYYVLSPIWLHYSFNPFYVYWTRNKDERLKVTWRWQCITAIYGIVWTEMNLKGEKFLTKLAYSALGKEVLRVCRQINDSRCIGCQYGHPSQLRHECVTETSHSIFTFYFDEAIKCVELKNIRSQFKKYALESRGRTRRPLPKIGKNMIFWRKIVIFHTKYPKNVRASLRSAQFF